MSHKKSKIRNITTVNATENDVDGRHAVPEFDEAKLRAKPWIAQGAGDNDRGYVLLDGKLVPYMFLDYLKENRPWNVLVYGTIIDPHSLLGDETWDQLDKDEREIAPACILHMIKSGDIFVNYMPGEYDRK